MTSRREANHDGAFSGFIQGILVKNGLKYDMIETRDWTKHMMGKSLYRTQADKRARKLALELWPGMLTAALVAEYERRTRQDNT